MIVRRGGGMGYVAEERIVVNIPDLVIGSYILEAGEQGQARNPIRSKPLRSGAEFWLPFPVMQRELPVRAEAVRGTGLVVGLNHNALVGELGLEMDGLAWRRAQGAG